MGYSLSLLAVKCADPDSALSELNIVRTDEFCGYARESLSGCILADDWYLLVAMGCNNRFLKPNVLSQLSLQFPIVACSVEEHVMFSSAEHWVDGVMVWRAEHVGENGPVHLNTTGVLPPSFETMAAAQKDKQQADGGEKADVDHYFDIPLNAAKSIMGFKHDEVVPGVDYDRFEILRKTRSPAEGKPWWRFWQ